MHDTTGNVSRIARDRFFLDYIMVDLCFYIIHSTTDGRLVKAYNIWYCRAQHKKTAVDTPIYISKRTLNQNRPKEWTPTNPDPPDRKSVV